MSAPKGNKYALGLTDTGRPRIYETVEALDVRINEYFEYIKGNEDEAREPEPPTVTGLTLHLGFCNKSTLYDYAKRKEFSNSIKRALTLVEQSYEYNLYSKQATGSIFALKNMGWKDQKHHDHTTDGESLNMSPEEREARIKELKKKLSK